MNEAAKNAQDNAQDRYSEAVNALYFAENSQLGAIESQNKRRREPGGGNHDLEQRYISAQSRSCVTMAFFLAIETGGGEEPCSVDDEEDKIRGLVMRWATNERRYDD